MKTEQEVREAITEEAVKVIVGDDYYLTHHLDEARKGVQDLAVIIGKALGVVE